MDVEVFLDHFAIRCFRDTADGDYIAARMSYRAGLTMQYLWSSQQAIEKYLKCILLLHRIKATDVRHDLEGALKRIEVTIHLDLTPRSKEFIAHIDLCGQCRYLEISWFSFGPEIIDLDRVVWELRRFCTHDTTLRSVVLREGCAAPKLRIHGGYLEKVFDDPSYPARAALLWQNGFIGKKPRTRVRVWKGFTFENSPLYLFPQFVDEVAKYVMLPKPLQAAYRDAAREKLRADAH
jgi:HEPN domain